MSFQNCNNCGKRGHIFKNCKSPIISHGVIVAIKSPQLKLLMVQRKYSFGYIDFIRGNYLLTNIMYIQRLVNEMTNTEKQNILTKSFKVLLCDMWNYQPNQELSTSESNSNYKFNSIKEGINLNKLSLSETIHKNNTFCNITLNDIVKNSPTSHISTEWEFPKGKKNFNEHDIKCAIRELYEETGIQIKQYEHIIKNIVPFEETFIGSNNKSYKYKYYVAMLNPKINNIIPHIQPSEISAANWKTIDECMMCIRNHSHEKKRIVNCIKELMNDFVLI